MAIFYHENRKMDRLRYSFSYNSFIFEWSFVDQMMTRIIVRWFWHSLQGLRWPPQLSFRTPVNSLPPLDSRRLTGIYRIEWTLVRCFQFASERCFHFVFSDRIDCSRTPLKDPLRLCIVQNLYWSTIEAKRTYPKILNEKLGFWF